LMMMERAASPTSSTPAANCTSRQSLGRTTGPARLDLHLSRFA
jgi:hypothetical protein